MRRIISGVLCAGALCTVPSVFAVTSKDRNAVASRLDESAIVLSEIMGAPDKGIPRDLIEKAHCVVVVPGLKKGAFIFGGQYGKGFVSCRAAKGRGWSAPGAVRMEGGSFGFQIGGSETDIVMLVMNERGAQKLLSSQFTLGGEGEVAAGPVGREATAQTDAAFRAEILSWSRTRGVFAGISLKGSTLRQDVDDNEAMYGKRIGNKEIVAKHPAPTPSGRKLVAVLQKYSSHEK
jgi:lipid-binding SYLF domain-containing protein